MSAHGMMHTVITNAWAGDPYHVEVLFMYMASWSLFWLYAEDEESIGELPGVHVQSQPLGGPDRAEMDDVGVTRRRGHQIERFEAGDAIEELVKQGSA